MGIYLNPGNRGFWESVRSEIYVDKTGLIAETNKCVNTEQKYLCVSRPRRFGKSMALKMLAAYYSRGCDSQELFAGYSIAEDPTYQEYLNRYDVVFLNMQQFLIEAASGKVTEYLEQEVLEELNEAYGTVLKGRELGLAAAFRKIYAKTDKQFIFLFDEWDCVMRERQESEMLQKRYLDFFRNLLKDQPYVALAYMTGILPIKKYGQHSALNMFWEYSMTNPFAFEEYTGFTEHEVKVLCEKYGMDFAQISNWYDGYQFRKFQHIYNPRSVVAAMKNRILSNYWTSTETYEALKVYIDMDFDGLRPDIVQMLGGGRVRVNMRSFQNDMKNLRTKDDVLTLLIHLGYLAYDADQKSVFIPNEEVRLEFLRAVKTGRHKQLYKIIQASEKLLQDTLNMDCKNVADAIEYIHKILAAPTFYNNEQALRSVIRFAYISCMEEFQEIQELPSGTGYADVVFLPKKCSQMPVMIVELKWNKSPNQAVCQIRERDYAQVFAGYGCRILFVGISYDTKTKKHKCVIEQQQL